MAEETRLGVNQGNVGLSALELFQPCAFDKSIYGLRCKNFPPGCEYHFLHIFPADSKTSATDTRDDFVFGIILGTSGKA